MVDHSNVSVGGVRTPSGPGLSYSRPGQGSPVMTQDIRATDIVRLGRSGYQVDVGVAEQVGLIVRESGGGYALTDKGAVLADAGDDSGPQTEAARSATSIDRPAPESATSMYNRADPTLRIPMTPEMLAELDAKIVVDHEESEVRRAREVARVADAKEASQAKREEAQAKAEAEAANVPLEGPMKDAQAAIESLPLNLGEYGPLAGEVVMQGNLDSPDLAAVAERLGISEEAAGSSYSAIREGYQDEAAGYLNTQHGIEDGTLFQLYAEQHDPEAFKAAVDQHVVGGNLDGYGALVQGFQQQAAQWESVEANSGLIGEHAQEDGTVTQIWEEGQRLWLHHPSVGSIPLSHALAAGLSPNGSR